MRRRRRPSAAPPRQPARSDPGSRRSQRRLHRRPPPQRPEIPLMPSMKLAKLTYAAKNTTPPMMTHPGAPTKAPSPIVAKAPTRSCDPARTVTSRPRRSSTAPDDTHDGGTQYHRDERHRLPAVDEPCGDHSSPPRECRRADRLPPAAKRRTRVRRALIGNVHDAEVGQDRPKECGDDRGDEEAENEPGQDEPVHRVVRASASRPIR